MIYCKLREFNKNYGDVYVVPLVDPNLESRILKHLVDLDFFSISKQTLKCIAEEAEILHPTPLDGFDKWLPPHANSRVSGESTDHVASSLKSTFVNAKVIARHLLAKRKLRRNLKVSFNLDPPLDIIPRIQYTTFLPDFCLKIHLMFNTYNWNWCQRKESNLVIIPITSL